MKLRHALLAASAITAFQIGMPAQAQQTSPASPAPAAAQDAPAKDDVIAEVVVTARRRAENLQDVPIAVSAVSGDALTRDGVTNVQDLQYRVPALSITSGFTQRSNASFSMRGQRTQETQLFTDPAVGTYFAEVVQPRPYGFNAGFYDLESVQVLRGVQGTLFGRNMTGGAVLVEPAHPKMDTVEGEVRGTFGNYNAREGYAMLNVPLGDKFALRIAGDVNRRDGWATDVGSGRHYNDTDYNSFRASLMAKPWEGVESLTIYDWYRSNENGTAAFLTSIAQPSVISNYEQLRQAGLITTNIPAEFAAAQALFKAHPYSLDIGAGDGSNLDAWGKPYEKNSNQGITNKTTIELSDDLTLKNIFGWRRLTRDVVQDYDGIPAFLITPYQFARISNYSEELQLQGSALNKDLTYILGGYFFKETGIDGSYANTLPQLVFAGARVPQTTPASLFLQQQTGQGYSQSYAAFAAGTYKITPEISLSSGVRYNLDQKKITVVSALPNLNSCQFDTDLNTPGVQSVPMSQCAFGNHADFAQITYDATLQYEPSDHLTTYASFRHGYRSGGFSTRAQNWLQLQPFRPEKVDEYEIGLKSNGHLWNGRWTTSAALFLQNGSDVQKQRAASIDTNGDGIPDTIVTVIDNTAEQRNTGGELEFTYNTDVFSLTGFYSYVNVEIEKGAAVLNGLHEIAQRGMPRHQLGLTGTVYAPIDPSWGQAQFTANFTWRSQIYLDDFEVQGLQSPYGLVNMRVEWNDIKHTGLNAALFCNNVLDKQYRVGVLGLIAEGLGFQSSVYGDPRMYGVQIGYKF